MFIKYDFPCVAIEDLFDRQIFQSFHYRLHYHINYDNLVTFLIKTFNTALLYEDGIKIFDWSRELVAVIALCLICQSKAPSV